VTVTEMRGSESAITALPKGWRRVRLGEVCELSKGRTPREEWYSASGVWLVRFRDVTSSGVNWIAGFRTFVDETYSRELKELKPGTVLVTADAHDPKSIGKKICLISSVPPHASPAYYSGELLGITPKSGSELIPELVLYWFQSEDGYREIQEYVDGVHLNVGHAKDMKIPLPPLAEQKRIMHIVNEQMTAVEKARVAAEARLEAAKALPVAYLRAVFEGEEANRWAQRKFDEIAVLQRGYDLPFKNKVAGKYPLVTSSGIAGYHNEFKANAPGVVTGRSGSIGKVYYITEDYWPHNTSLFIRDFKGNVPLYIFYFLQWLNTEKVGSGTGVPTLDRKSVHRLTVGYPDIDTQNHIASILSQKNAEALKIAKIIQQELETINALPASLLRLAFTGGL